MSDFERRYFQFFVRNAIVDRIFTKLLSLLNDTDNGSRPRICKRITGKGKGKVVESVIAFCDETKAHEIRKITDRIEEAFIQDRLKNDSSETSHVSPPSSVFSASPGIPIQVVGGIPKIEESIKGENPPFVMLDMNDGIKYSGLYVFIDTNTEPTLVVDCFGFKKVSIDNTLSELDTDNESAIESLFNTIRASTWKYTLLGNVGLTLRDKVDEKIKESIVNVVKNVTISEKELTWHKNMKETEGAGEDDYRGSRELTRSSIISRLLAP